MKNMVLSYNILKNIIQWGKDMVLAWCILKKNMALSCCIFIEKHGISIVHIQSKHSIVMVHIQRKTWYSKTILW